MSHHYQLTQRLHLCGPAGYTYYYGACHCQSMSVKANFAKKS